MQTDYTVSLPGFPTLLSAEGDFLIKAGSIHVTHNTFNNTTQSRRRNDRRSTTSQPEKGAEQDLKETSSGERGKWEKKERFPTNTG